MCALSYSAPNNDLNFLKDLEKYHDIEVAQVALNAISRQLWYLSEILIGCSVFDYDIHVKEKRKMISNLWNNQGSQEPRNRIFQRQNNSLCTIADFVTTTKKFFEILNIDIGFFDKAPENWTREVTCIQARICVSSPQVTNDLAEREVALMKSFNDALVRDEDQEQFVLQVVEYHKKIYGQPLKNWSLLGE